MSDSDDLINVLKRNGFVRCDIAACNCGSWHARYGLPERMADVKAILEDAGHPPCNENGNLVGRALTGLVEERDSLRTRLEAAEKDAARLNLELQKRDKCSYMGPMRDCPTHGESAELKAMREAMTKEPT